MLGVTYGYFHNDICIILRFVDSIYTREVVKCLESRIYLITIIIDAG